MGMRIGGANPAGASQGVGNAQWQQRQQGVKDMMAALQAGDLGAAQKAWTALSANGGGTRSNSPLGQIGQALQNGDLAGAQKAAQAWQAARGGHHHRHGAEGAAAVSTAGAAGGTGALINLTA